MKNRIGKSGEDGNSKNLAGSSYNYPGDKSQGGKKVGKGERTKTERQEDPGPGKKSPDRKIEIDDDPNQTERKIPRMK